MLYPTLIFLTIAQRRKGKRVDNEWVRDSWNKGCKCRGSGSMYFKGQQTQHNGTGNEAYTVLRSSYGREATIRDSTDTLYHTLTYRLQRLFQEQNFLKWKCFSKPLLVEINWTNHIASFDQPMFVLIILRSFWVTKACWLNKLYDIMCRVPIANEKVIHQHKVLTNPIPKSKTGLNWSRT